MAVLSSYCALRHLVSRAVRDPLLKPVIVGSPPIARRIVLRPRPLPSCLNAGGSGLSRVKREWFGTAHIGGLMM